jgi:16S rRNA (cytosine967-C5)-methyltransferase
MVHSTQSSPTARGVVVDALAEAASRFPDLWPGGVHTAGLSAADGRLALAIHRAVLQRWLTLEYLLNRHLHQKLRKVEPELAAILLSGAAQLLLMQRMPVYAVIDEAVGLAKQRLRKRAGGLVNAVLRKLAADVAAVEPDQPWEVAWDQLPLGSGRVRLSGGVLPDSDDWQRFWSVVTSHGPALIERWHQALGPERTEALALQGLAQPPTIVAVEPGFEKPADDTAWQAHQQPGFLLWQGGPGALSDFLSAHPARRVQDPAAAQAVQATAELAPKTILDLCAGRGTKTRQLATLHPEARVVATDINVQRQAELRELARELSNVELADYDNLPGERFDLVLLDVPCSNTGVLARRPEARYRFSDKHLRELTRTQQSIIDRARPYVRSGGHLLYTTCSIDPAENEQQTDYLEKQTGGEVIHEDRWLPGGAGQSYHDGSYHALLAV